MIPPQLLLFALRDEPTPDRLLSSAQGTLELCHEDPTSFEFDEQDCPRVVLLPVIEEDLHTVKQLRSLADRHPTVLVAAWCSTAPSLSFLAYAFREGLADLLFLDASPTETAFRIKRLALRSEERWAAHQRERNAEHQLAEMRQVHQRTAHQQDQWDRKSIRQLRATRALLDGQVTPNALAVACGSEARRRRLEKAAEALSLELRTYGTGAALLEAAQIRPPTVLLADGVLPDGELPDLVAKLRNLTEELYVIAWSTDATYGPEDGIDDIVPKSHEPDGFELAMSAMLVGLGTQLTPA